MYGILNTLNTYGFDFRFDYESTIEEINTILMKSYYYHYNTGMKISRVYKK